MNDIGILCVHMMVGHVPSKLIDLCKKYLDEKLNPTREVFCLKFDLAKRALSFFYFHNQWLELIPQILGEN